mgnify:CR=1 FL=1
MSRGSDLIDEDGELFCPEEVDRLAPPAATAPERAVSTHSRQPCASFLCVQKVRCSQSDMLSTQGDERLACARRAQASRRRKFGGRPAQLKLSICSCVPVCAFRARACLCGAAEAHN